MRQRSRCDEHEALAHGWWRVAVGALQRDALGGLARPESAADHPARREGSRDVLRVAVRVVPCVRLELRQQLPLPRAVTRADESDAATTTAQRPSSSSFCVCASMFASDRGSAPKDLRGAATYMCTRNVRRFPMLRSRSLLIATVVALLPAACAFNVS